MPWPLAVYYDAECRVCRRLAHRARALDAAGRLALRPAQGALGAPGVPAGLLGALHARAGEGEWLAGGTAVAAVLEALGHRRLAGALRLPGVRTLWGLAYTALAATRSRWARFVLPNEPEIEG